MYYVYMLECQDGSYYTGFTNDVTKRIQKHCLGKGAKYTRSHPPKVLKLVLSCTEESDARKLEYAIKKHLTHQDKEFLALNPNRMQELLPSFGHESYQVIENITLEKCLEEKL